MTDKLETLVARGKELRVILGELRAEGQRLKTENDERWKQHEPILQALRDRPSEETARAYVAHLDWINGLSTYRQRGDLDEKRRGVLDELRKVCHEVCTILGIGWTEEDWSMP